MIKTEYFDDEYNSVCESDAQLILQSIYDDDGNLVKKIEWSQKSKKVPKNKDDYNKIISQDIMDHYAESIIGIQRGIDLLWRYHAVSDDVSEKHKIIKDIFFGYDKKLSSLLYFDQEVRRKKGGFDFRPPL